MTKTDGSDDTETGSEDEERIRAEFDWSSWTPSEGVIETVANAANVDPTAIKPLYGSVEPDALDALVRLDGRDPKHGVTVTFTHEGYEVQVRSDGVVTVRPAA